MFVREADEAVCLDPGPDAARGSGYLDYGALERALVEARADAAWVGWGFVAEHPGFGELCERLGIVFVGPEPAVMRTVGDKIAAKRLAEAAGVPVAPWSNGPVRTAEEAVAAAEHIGFPLMVKATAGGGGRGIRRVDAPDGLPAAFLSAAAEAEQAFGDGTLLLERLITPARHIEVQVIADGQGAAWAVGVRDCTCQRRHQKVIEESAALRSTAEQQRRDPGGGAAPRAARRLPQRRHGRVPLRAGDAPLLVHGGQCPAPGRAPRHRAGHRSGPRQAPAARRRRRPTGGRAARRARPRRRGPAERRGPGAGLPPAPGRVALLRLPTGPHVRVDTGVAEGDAIPAEFDSMIAKLIAWGATATRRSRGCAARSRTPSSSSRAGPPTRGSCSSCSTGRSSAPATWTPTGWTGSSFGATSCPCATRTSRSCRRRSRSARARRPPTARASTRSPAAAGPRPTRAPHARSSCATADRSTAARSARSAPDRHRVTVDGATVEAVVRRAGTYERRLESPAPSTARSSPNRAPTCSSRSTASRTASVATTAGSSATWRRPSSCRSPSRRATKSRPATWSRWSRA